MLDFRPKLFADDEPLFARCWRRGPEEEVEGFDDDAIFGIFKRKEM